MEEATVETLAPEGVAEAQTTVEESGPDLKAIWNKHNPPDDVAGDASQDGEPVEEATAEEAPVEDPPEEPPVEEAPEAPTDLRREVREAWKDIPAAARDAILASEREKSAKLSDLGRRQQQLAPIQDVLVDAVKKLPGMSDMKPADVAREAFELAQYASGFRTQPVETIMGLIQKHGLGEAVGEALTGKQPSQQSMGVNTLQRENQQLKQTLATLNERLTGVETAPVRTTINEFAGKAEHWQDVEATLPRAIEYVLHAEPDLAPAAALEKAYNLEIQRLGKAPQPAADQAVATVDPETTAKALKAKSVNVTGSPTGKTVVKSERDMLREIYRKNHS